MLEEKNWYAIQTKPTANQNRNTQIVGGKFRTRTDRTGRKRKCRIRGTGQRKFVIEILLRKRGFDTFLPAKKVWRLKSKHTKEKHLVAYPLLVNWAFVGWPKGEERWHDLFACNLIKGVAGIDGRPYVIPQDVMNEMLNRWSGLGAQSPECEKFMRTHHEFKVGDQVKIAEGPLDGQLVDVVELHGPKTKVLLTFLGGAQILEIDTMQLEAG